MWSKMRAKRKKTKKREENENSPLQFAPAKFGEQAQVPSELHVPRPPHVVAASQKTSHRAPKYPGAQVAQSAPAKFDVVQRQEPSLLQVPRPLQVMAASHAAGSATTSQSRSPGRQSLQLGPVNGATHATHSPVLVSHWPRLLHVTAASHCTSH